MNSTDTGDDMMLSIYFTLGVLLLLAVRNPAEHRSLIAFAAWSSLAHAVVMSALAFQPAQTENRNGFLVGSAVLVVIGALLIVLAPRSPHERSSASISWSSFER
ncbi:MAG TPA: DUF6632 domain-containing protein [Candidatus Acidoferrales bacterium]|nr:DUF6632 domain-containing protein [Candidatus Acidoferrales bacterium]